MKWYLAALVVAPAFFFLVDLGLRRIDPWKARHRTAFYAILALMEAAILVGRGLAGVRSVGDWLAMIGTAFMAVFLAAMAVRARQVRNDPYEPAA
jgi:hypothetical protein